MSSIFQGDSHFIKHIISLLGSVTSASSKSKQIKYAFKPTCSTTASSEAKSTENVFEVDVVEDILLAESTHSSMTELVIGTSFLLIRKHSISFADFFEFFTSFGVFAYIRVIFHGQFSVGLFNILFTGSFFHSQDFVIISLLCHD
jgi:hypothetical protein